jgi:hypothetical protein
MYERDESHPVPDLSVIDVNAVKEGGGANLYIVIAQPLRADRRSLERLMRKLEVYLGFVNSEQFKAESGIASAENTNIIVRIHPDSDAVAFDLLERNRQWVRSNNATLVVDASLPTSQ